MKSSTLIASYLWKDTWSRWLEQPSTLLARLFVGAVMVAVATTILVTFTLLVRSVRARLESFGLNTLVVREMIPSNDPEMFFGADRPDRLHPLATAGEKLRLRQLFARAQTDWQSDLIAISYSTDALALLSPWFNNETPLICFSETLPEFIRVQVRLQHQTGFAIVRKLPDLFRPLGIEHGVLMPRGWAPEAEKMGFIDITLFQRYPDALPVQRYAEGVGTLFALERRPLPQIQSALPLVRELEQLQEKQALWRQLLAGGLGLAIALVFGAIAVLEFRQNLFIGALLRSLGAPGLVLYLRQWLENGVIANASAAAAIGLVALFHHELFGALGFRGAVLDYSQGNPYLSSEVGLILLCVNAGAFLSSLPVAIGLRKPVGTILN